MSQGFSIPRFKLPAFVSAIGANLPQWPHSLALATALNAAAKIGCCPTTASRCSKGAASSSRCSTPADRPASPIATACFRPLFNTPQAPDLAFRANLSAFLQLLARQEDPDTLFFNRELSIVGDTELGLVIKNMLDAVEWPSLPTRPIFATESRLRAGPRHAIPGCRRPRAHSGRRLRPRRRSACGGSSSSFR
jgi:hypothetical protein